MERLHFSERNDDAIEAVEESDKLDLGNIWDDSNKKVNDMLVFHRKNMFITIEIVKLKSKFESQNFKFEFQISIFKTKNLQNFKVK